MNKKKGVFFGAIAIDIFLICLGYAVFYAKVFDETTSIILTWIVVIGCTFMMIITIGLAVVIPRKRKIKLRIKKKIKQEEHPEFKVVEEEQPEEQPEELPEFKVVEDEKTNVKLERTTSEAGIVTIRRVVTKEDIAEIEDHIDEEKIGFKEEMQQVIDKRTKEVEDVVDDLINSKIEKKEKHIEQIHSKVEKKETPERRPVQDKIYKYMDDHPEATASEVRKAVKCKISTAKKYRSQWSKK
jgi:hypothetical protein